jgi:rubrerythrin
MALNQLLAQGLTTRYSRRTVLKGSVALGAGAAALSFLGGPIFNAGTGAEAAPLDNDLTILNYALTLEYLEAAFYKDVVKSGLFKGEELAVLKKFGAEEQQHVEALSGTVKKLGGKPAPMPKAEFPLKSAKSVAELAGTVENLGAAAYLGQAANIKSPEVLAAALSIHSVEARHAATLNTLLKLSITPDGAFGKPADVATVLKSVEPFIVG